MAGGSASKLIMQNASTRIAHHGTRKRTHTRRPSTRKRKRARKRRCAKTSAAMMMKMRQKQPHERCKRIGRGGWSVKCKQLIDHILNKEWCEATALAEEYNSSHAFVAMD